jgi:hypothetical protein
MSLATSAVARRLDRNAAIIAAHPRWHGIRHPELIPFPRRRFSQLDMLPVVERTRSRMPPVAEDARGSRAERIAHTREIVAAHPRWHGIRHPERVVFSTVAPLLDRERAARLGYEAAVLRAVRGVRESEELCAQITSVAAAIDRRPWPWAASPDRIEPTQPAPPSRWRGLRALATQHRLRLAQHGAGRLVRPASRPIAH